MNLIWLGHPYALLYWIHLSSLWVQCRNTWLDGDYRQSKSQRLLINKSQFQHVERVSSLLPLYFLTRHFTIVNFTALGILEYIIYMSITRLTSTLDDYTKIFFQLKYPFERKSFPTRPKRQWSLLFSLTTTETALLIWLKLSGVLMTYDMWHHHPPVAEINLLQQFQWLRNCH